MRRPALHIDRLPQYGTLLVALFVDVVIAPMIIASGADFAVARLIMGAVLAAAFLAVGTHGTSAAAFLVTLSALVFATLWTSAAAITVDLVLRIVFIGYVSGHILVRVLQRREVTLDTIAGAACVYMLLGLLWATGYLLLEHVRPGSFNIPDSWRVEDPMHMSPALVYFSFATLTTVGFGDVTPAGPAAGGLVVVEAVIGQLFLAITIARLVGLHIARQE